MKKNTIKVYMEWVNYLGEIQSRELIAEFISENWARHFIETSKDAVDGKFTKLVIE